MNSFIYKGFSTKGEIEKMARSSRQSKILELISTRDIGSQDELVSYLKAANFDITQATISRDIKELGLIKILTGDGKYKYALMDSSEQAVSNKNISIFKELVISIKTGCNLCVVKTVKGFANGICSMIDKLNVENLLGAFCGDDTVSLVFENNDLAQTATNTLLDLLK